VLQEEREEEEYARRRIDRLREEFVKEKDNVNVYWLEQTLLGNTDLGQMARDSGRTVGGVRRGPKAAQPHRGAPAGGAERGKA
jgi:hypothetical protein